MSSRLISFEVDSVERSNPGSDLPVFKVVEGSLCIFTVSKCTDADSRLELCPVCSVHPSSELQKPSCSEPTLPVVEGTQYQLMLGQAPDLAPAKMSCAPDQKKHYSFRSLLEHAILGSVLQDLVTVQYYRDEVTANTNSKMAFSISFKLDRIEYPPQCRPHNPLPNIDPSEEISAFVGRDKDPLENPTNDWNPELATHWSQRAWALKERGTWIVQRHVNKQKVTSGDSDVCVWSAAFTCYSRALQLATLARSARERCTPDTRLGDADVSVELIPPSVGQLDIDQLPDYVKSKFDSSLASTTRLEFNLLLNLALCQLKAGSADFAGDNCSQALSLDPGWAEAVSNEATQATQINNLTRQSLVLSHIDIAKALYRRAQAHLRTGNAEEAKVDAECARRLYSLTVSSAEGVDESKRHDNAAAVAASQALISQACQRISRDKDILIERIRKHRNRL